MQFLRVVGGVFLLGVSGCGAKTGAVATRVLDAGAVVSASPVCFVPPNPEWSLTERAQQQQIIQICEDAARNQSVPVVTFGNGQCLAATLSWAVRDTGDRTAGCNGTWTGGAECYSTAVRVKSLKVALTESTGKVLAETTASIGSTRNDFTRQTFRALCTAAFHEFPQPLANEQFDVPLE